MISILAGGIPPSQTAWIQPFALIFPILFLVNIAFLIYWGITKSKYVLIPVIVTLVAFGNIFDNFQITLFNSDYSITDHTKIISYNVQNFGEQTNNDNNLSVRNDIVSFLEEQEADLVCLQEYYSSGNKLYESIKLIRDTLSLTSYYYESYFDPKYDMLSGMVILSRYKAVNKGKLKFTGTRTFGIYTDVLIDNDTVRIFNIHLASIRLRPEDLDFVVSPDAENSKQFKSHTSKIYQKLIQAYELREKQLINLVDVINSTPYNIILTGDFNDTPSSWVYTRLNDYLTDTYVAKGKGISHTYAGPLPYLRIDYIMISDHFETRQFEKHNFDKSDHYPISAIIKKN
jgi:endonuclease/exonuclease/phosphatase family metal-dependent hydrolase